MKKETNMKQKPEVTPDEHFEGERLKHPAFGQITARRIQGGGDQRFYGSDFSHQHWIDIVISSSTEVRRIGRDSQFAEAELVRVSMTEAQWATFLSSMNVGDGVPCTFKRMAGKGYPDIEPLETKEDHFKRSMSETVEKSVAKIDELMAALDSDAVKISKKARDELLRLAGQARTEISQNTGFVATQFGEHIEERVEEAKVSIAAYANHIAPRTVGAAIAAAPSSPALPSPGTDESEQDG